MPETLESELRIRGRLLTAGMLSFEEFEDWFVPATFDDRDDPLVREIDHVLVRRSAGEFNDSSALIELRRLIDPVPAADGWLSVSVTFSSNMHQPQLPAPLGLGRQLVRTETALRTRTLEPLLCT